MMESWRSYPPDDTSDRWFARGRTRLVSSLQGQARLRAESALRQCGLWVPEVIRTPYTFLETSCVVRSADGSF